MVCSEPGFVCVHEASPSRYNEAEQINAILSREMSVCSPMFCSGHKTTWIVFCFVCFGCFMFVLCLSAKFLFQSGDDKQLRFEKPVTKRRRLNSSLKIARPWIRFDWRNTTNSTFQVGRPNLSFEESSRSVFERLLNNNFPKVGQPSIRRDTVCFRLPWIFRGEIFWDLSTLTRQAHASGNF